MLTGRFFITLVGIIVAFLALCNMDFSKPVVEGWGWTMTPMRPIARVQFTSPDGRTTAGPNYFDPSSDPNAYSKGSFVSTPQFQSVLAPRFSNLSYGADIRYNLPDRKNMGVPCHPLSYGDMASQPAENYVSPQTTESRNSESRASKENYNGSCAGGCSGDSGVVSCGPGGYGMGHRVAGGYPLKPGYTADGGCLTSNWQEVYDSLPHTDVETEPLPIATMSSMDGAGNMQQVVVSERLYSVNQKNRNAGLADLIRGDLPITPCQTGWFSVSVNPATNLWGGALLAMNGDGSTNMATLDLMTKATAGAVSANGGVDMNEMPSYRAMVQGSSVLGSSAGGGDVVVTQFP